MLINNHSKELLDPFVSIVYEDSFVNTDIINGNDSPRWLPPTNRAFVFNMIHPSSQINIGVIDFKENNLDGNHPIGRATVDLNIAPDIEYLFTYPLYMGANINEELPKGSISIRVRMEIQYPRKLVMTSLKLPPTLSLNVDRKLDYEVLEFTLEGKNEDDAPEIRSHRQKLDEIRSYKTALAQIKTAILNVLCWRGTYEVVYGIYIPVHSIVIFIILVEVAERPNLIPSVVMGIFAWVMLAVLKSRRLNLLDAPKPYLNTLAQLFCGYVTPHSIVEEECRNLIKGDGENSGVITAGVINKIQAVVEENDNGVRSNFSIKQILETGCDTLRVIRNIVTWRETYYSFWLTTFAFLSMIIFAFVPWGLFFFWSFKVAVWVFLGPWMYLVEKLMLQRYTPKFIARKNRIKRENALKMKDMICLLFGQHVKRIHILKRNQHPDISHLSSSKPNDTQYDGNDTFYSSVKDCVKARLHGQRIQLDMTPKLSTKEISYDALPTFKTEVNTDNYNDRKTNRLQGDKCNAGGVYGSVASTKTL